MKGDIYERAVDEAIFIIENQSTVREAAKKFGISKSTVHKDMTERLQEINRTLYSEVRKVLDVNLDDRASRGGQATKMMYRHKRAIKGEIGRVESCFTLPRMKSIPSLNQQRVVTTTQAFR